MKRNKSLLSEYYLLLILLATIITAGIDLYSYNDVNYGTLYIQRQFGNEIKFNILFIIILFGTIIGIGLLHRRKRKDKSSIKLLLIAGSLSLLLPNGKDIHLAIIGWFSLIKYYLLFFSFLQIYDFDSFKKNLRKVLIVVLWIESIGGFLQTFLNIYIPFLTSRNVESYRGSTLRMTGTMLFSADFALVITFVTIFLLCDYLFNQNKKDLKYIIVCLVDLWFSGSRTMIIATLLIVIYNLKKRYRDKPIYIIGIISVVLVGVYVFIQSSSFIEYFVADSIAKMFSTRLVHWRMGWDMITSHPLFGVGLNNSVLYVNLNPDIVQRAYKISIEPMSFFFTNPIHNSIIIMFAELGIVGGSIYFSIFLEPIIYCLKRKGLFDRKDLLFVISESIMLIVYAFQGWGSLREHGMVLMVIMYTYYYLLKVKTTAKGRKSING